MAIHDQITSFITSNFEANPALFITSALSLLAVVVFLVNSRDTNPGLLPEFPLVSFEERGLSPLNSWLYHAVELIQKGLREHPNGFQIMQSTGPRIILPNRYADEIKKVPEWSFMAWVFREFFASYRGLEPFRSGAYTGDGGHLLVDTTRVKITQSLNGMTDDLRKESSSTIKSLFGDSREWQSTDIKEKILHLIAHMNALAFLGKELAQNEEWIEISKTYTSNAFAASKDMRKYPNIIRPLAYWFIPRCQKARSQVQQARKIINPVVAKRSAAHLEDIAAGKKPRKLYDAVSWVLDVAHGEPVDIASFQLGLSTVAMSTTAEMTTYALIELCEHPEYFEPLRKEIIEAVSSEGWSKTMLYKLKLMDSFLKESQRLHVTNWSLMRRIAGTPLTLSDGRKIPKGAVISVSLESMSDPTIYPDPQKFDGFRFYRKRQEQGQENAHQLVSVSTDHMGFGYGEHACPGRFLAANQVKIAFVHLLLKYDWSFPEGITKALPDTKFETQHMVNPDTRLMCRRREEEVSLDD